MQNFRGWFYSILKLVCQITFGPYQFSYRGCHHHMAGVTRFTSRELFECALYRLIDRLVTKLADFELSQCHKASSVQLMRSLSSHCLPWRTYSAFFPQKCSKQKLDNIDLTCCPLVNASGPLYHRQTDHCHCITGSKEVFPPEQETTESNTDFPLVEINGTLQTAGVS